MKFHPYLISEFYTNAIISATVEFFSTKVYGTKLDISPRYLAEEFGLNNSGTTISTYLEDARDNEH